MSRSYKKNMAGSITGGVCGESEKKYKKICHGRFRAKTRICIHNHSEVFPHRKQVYDPWAGPKDGKIFYCWENSKLREIEDAILAAVKYGANFWVDSRIDCCYDFRPRYCWLCEYYHACEMCQYYGIKIEEVKMLSQKDIRKYLRMEMVPFRRK